jgi:hypothetical protein
MAPWTRTGRPGSAAGCSGVDMGRRTGGEVCDQGAGPATIDIVPGRQASNSERRPSCLHQVHSLRRAGVVDHVDREPPRGPVSHGGRAQGPT